MLVTDTATSLLVTDTCKITPGDHNAEAPAEGSQLDGPGQEAYRPKGNEGSPWQADKAAGMVLSTLYLALEWSLQAHPANRSPTAATHLYSLKLL